MRLSAMREWAARPVELSDDEERVSQFAGIGGDLVGNDPI